jgi:hypothetical protein
VLSGRCGEPASKTLKPLSDGLRSNFRRLRPWLVVLKPISTLVMKPACARIFIMVPSGRSADKLRSFLKRERALGLIWYRR